MVVFIDAIFATNEEFLWLLGFFICFTDNNGTANGIYFTPIKFRLTAGSVFASNLYGFVLKLDQEFVTVDVLERILI